jgi:hypothetical protein
MTLKSLFFAAGRIYCAQLQSEAAYPRTMVALVEEEMALKSAS